MGEPKIITEIGAIKKQFRISFVLTCIGLALAFFSAIINLPAWTTMCATLAIISAMETIYWKNVLRKKAIE